MALSHTIFQWIDLFWIPVALLTMEKGKRLLTCGFILSCVLLLRLQIQLFEQIGWKNGFFGLMETSLYCRGLAVYGAFTALFLILAHFSRGSDKAIHMAASITILIVSFCVSTASMVL